MNQPATPVVTSRSFDCDSATRQFTFDYPVPDGWDAVIKAESIPGDSAELQCTIYWQHESIRFVMPPTTTVTWVPTATPVTEPYTRTADGTSVQFFDDDQMVTVTSVGVPSESGLSPALITDTAIDTFQWLSLVQ